MGSGIGGVLQSEVGETLACVYRTSGMGAEGRGEGLEARAGQGQGREQGLGVKNGGGGGEAQGVEEGTAWKETEVEWERGRGVFKWPSEISQQG